MKNNIQFLGIGAAKAGTTWLADMLTQHPQIFIPKQKEIHYFNKEYNEDPGIENYNYFKDSPWFFSFFKDSTPEQIKGEISPSYLYDPHAAKRIAEFDPNIKIIAILRDPVQRTYSHYLHYQQRGTFGNQNFATAIKEHPDMLIKRSLYYEQIKRYSDLFPEAQLKIVLFEDMVKDPVNFLKDIEQFLGVSEFIPENIKEKSNITGRSRIPLVNQSLAYVKLLIRKFKLHKLNDLLRFTKISNLAEHVRKTNRISYSTKPEIDKEIISKLYHIFLPDIEKLEKLLQKDLSCWKKYGSNENNEK